MSLNEWDELTGRFKLLSHPARLQILEMLRRDEACVCHMETALGKRQAYISQQLMVLRDAGMVSARKDGLQVFYRLTDSKMEAILAPIFGPVTEEDPARLEGCSCPHCVIGQENVPEPIKTGENHANS